MKQNEQIIKTRIVRRGFPSRYFIQGTEYLKCEQYHSITSISLSRVYIYNNNFLISPDNDVDMGGQGRARTCNIPVRMC